MGKDLEKLALCRKREIDSHLRINLRSKSWYQQNVFMAAHMNGQISDALYFNNMCRLMGRKPTLFSEEELQNIWKYCNEPNA